jgi:hypothetical protein
MQHIYAGHIEGRSRMTNCQGVNFMINLTTNGKLFLCE